MTVTMSGTLSLPGGTWDAFGDQALLTSTGGTPFGAQLTESGANPAESMSVELSVRLPGEIEETTGDRSDGAVRWSAPLDGSVARSGDAVRAQRRRRRAAGPDRSAPPPSSCSSPGWSSGSPSSCLVLRARSRRRKPPRRRLY